MVLLVVIVLGIGAGATLFMSSGTRRIDKHSELNQKAWFFAQSAVEEILVKITNNAADFDAEKRYALPAHATEFMAQQAGVEIGKVEILGRLVEKPKDAEEAKKFMELMTAGPGFASDTVRSTANGDPNKDWREVMEADAAHFSHKGAFKDLVKKAEGAGEEYHNTEWTSYANRTDFQDGNKIRDGFYALTPLTKLDFVANPAASHGLDTVVTPATTTEEIPAGEVQQFAMQWDLAMEAVADRVKNRIDGCAGNPNYGFGAEISAFVLGAASDADSDAEEEFRESAQAGGILEYSAHLVTVHAEAKASGGGVSAKQPVTVHRLVSRIDAKKAMDIMRDNLVVYLIHHYNLTPRDLAAMGWITISQDGNPVDLANFATINWDSAKITPNPAMLTKLNKRYPDNPNPKVFPFQAATCLASSES